MKRSPVLSILAAAVLLLLGNGVALADSISVTLIPANGNVFGLPSSAVGWGYTITNDTGDWLVTLALSADPFQHGTPETFFDFPALPPNSSVSVDFVANVAGLYQLTWDTTAPKGFVNAGTFIVSSDFYSGDPTSGGIDLGPAPDISAAYTATVSSVPEPASIGLLISGLAAVTMLTRLTTSAWPRLRE